MNFLGLPASPKRPDLGIRPELTEIHLSKADPTGSKPRWRITVNPTHDLADENDSPEIFLEDPFEEDQYEDIQFLVDGHHLHPRKTADDLKILEGKRKVAIGSVETYAKRLLETLPLVSSPTTAGRNVLIVEELDDQPQPQDRSSHGLAWELCENPKSRPSGSGPVSIIRVLCRRDNIVERRKPTATGFGTGKLIRMLLVIGRNVNKSYKPRSDLLDDSVRDIDAGLIQRPLMQVIQHLSQTERNFRIDLEYVTPESPKALEKLLEDRQAERTGQVPLYDIIHLDMHGDKQEAHLNTYTYYVPTLLLPNFRGRGVNSAVQVESIARILRNKTRMLVMNACNMGGLGGGFGVDMARHFISNDIEAVCATSFRLLASAAAIFYPVFYLSLFLEHSFDHAAARARQALREKKLRWKDKNGISVESEDDFIHWNFYNAPGVHDLGISVPSFTLIWRAVFAKISSCFYRWKCQAFGTTYCASRRHESDLSLYENFYDLGSHIEMAKSLDVPSIKLDFLSVGHWLGQKENKHSVYLYPRTTLNGTQLWNIYAVVDDMIMIWLKTGFVDAVHVFDLEFLRYKPGPIKAIDPIIESMRTPKVYRSSGQRQKSKRSGIRNMLVVKNYDTLESNHGGRSSEQQSALKWLAGVAEYLGREKRQTFMWGGEAQSSRKPFYLLTIGTAEKKQFKSSPIDVKLVGDLWLSAECLELEYEGDLKPATFKSRIQD